MDELRVLGMEYLSQMEAIREREKELYRLLKTREIDVDEVKMLETRRSLLRQQYYYLLNMGNQMIHYYDIGEEGNS